MGRPTGFWAYLQDHDTRRHWEVADAASAAQEGADRANERIRRLERQVEMMHREQIALRTIVGVLAQTLKDTDVIDDRLLDARLEAALEDAFAPPPPPAPAAAVGPIMVECQRCQQTVPASSTTMTAEGPKCDRCPPPR